MWPWFWKWETLALPIWRLELITNKIKQNYLKQRDLAPLNQVENWVEKLCLSLHERCTPQNWSAWGTITLLFFVKLVSQRQCKTRCTETWNGFGPYHFSYYCRLLLTPDPKETSHTCRRCGQGKYSSIAHTLKVSRQGSQNLSRCNSAF